MRGSKSLNGRLARVENLAQSLFDPEPKYSQDALNVWRTALEFSSLVFSEYGGDRQRALDHFDEFPPDLRLKLGAFDWTLMAFLSPLVSDEAKAVPDFRTEFLWTLGAVADVGLESGETVDDLARPEVLSQAIELVSGVMVEVENGDIG